MPRAGNVQANALDVCIDEWVARLLARAALLPSPLRQDVLSGLTRFAAERNVAELPPQGTSQSVVDSLDDGVLSELGRSVGAMAGALPWEPTTRSDDDGRDLGLCVFGPLLGLDATQAGLMLVRPGSQYPLHRHAPAEAYLVLSGTGSWRFGGAEDFVPVEPGSIVVNNRADLHSAIAGEEPLLAFYVLWP